MCGVCGVSYGIKCHFLNMPKWCICDDFPVNCSVCEKEHSRGNTVLAVLVEWDLNGDGHKDMFPVCTGCYCANEVALNACVYIGESCYGRYHRILNGLPRMPCLRSAFGSHYSLLTNPSIRELQKLREDDRASALRVMPVAHLYKLREILIQDSEVKIATELRAGALHAFGALRRHT